MKSSQSSFKSKHIFLESFILLKCKKCFEIYYLSKHDLDLIADSDTLASPFTKNSLIQLPKANISGNDQQ